MTSPFFNLANSANEQELLEGLIVESINIYGLDVYYVPRRIFGEDQIYKEDSQSYFDTAYPTTMYLKNVEGFQGMGHFLTKFAGGLEIRDQCTWVTANQTFMDDVGTIEGFTRPREGDLVYFLQNKKCYEITFAEKYRMFYPLGGLFSYDLTCQLYEYSGQNFTTGTEVDLIQPRLSEDYYDFSILTENGFSLISEVSDIVLLETYQKTDRDPMDETDEISKESSSFLDFTEQDPFSEGTFS